MMTKNNLGNNNFTNSVVRFLKHSMQKVLGKLISSTTMDKLMETGSGNNSAHLVAVSPGQK